MNVVGRYTILEQLGAGAMGTVYRAQDSVLERDVALKTIRTSATVDPDVRERFYREARACARLQHPNIVSVFDVGEIDRIAYIAMELLRGQDFRKLIEIHFPMTVAEKIDAMIQVCEALDHAHRHGVIHRDIKPSNIFRQDDGRVKIVDFGIARLPSSRATLQTAIMGTPNYMSPEHILGKPTDARSDLFSAGLVFFELLTYAHPFQSKGIPTRIVEGEPDSLFDHDTAIPVPLETIITARALAKDPNQRYSSGAELANDLRAVLDRLRNNASPYASKVQLPSQRLPIQPKRTVAADPAIVLETPKGEDTAEWRLTEVLRLSFEFDEALERQDQEAARAALRQLRAIAAADSRFVAPAADYSQSYAQLWGEYPESGDMVSHTNSAMSPGPDTPSDILPTPITGAAEGADASGVAVVPAKTEPVQQATSASAPDTRPGPPIPSPLPADVLARSREILGRYFGHSFNRDQKKLVIGAIAACALLIAFATVSNRLTGGPRAEPALGTLIVTSPQSAIRDTPNPSGRVLTQARYKDSLNLLELPVRRGQTWLHVQAFAAGKKPLTAGYIATADVANWPDWSIYSLESTVKLTSAMCPDEPLQKVDVQVCIAKWRSVETSSAGTQEENIARAAAAKLDQTLAAGSSDGLSGAQGASGPTAGASTQPQGGPGLSGRSGATEPPKQEVLTADQMVARGRTALTGSNPNISRARYWVREALKVDSKHAGALALVQDIREVEENVEQSK